MRTRQTWNDFLSRYQMRLNSNSVISTSFRKYLHPKETLIDDGVVSKDLLTLLDRESPSTQQTMPGASLANRRTGA